MRQFFQDERDEHIIGVVALQSRIRRQQIRLGHGPHGFGLFTGGQRLPAGLRLGRCVAPVFGRQPRLNFLFLLGLNFRKLPFQVARGRTVILHRGLMPGRLVEKERGRLKLIINE